MTHQSALTLARDALKIGHAAAAEEAAQFARTYPLSYRPARRAWLNDEVRKIEEALAAVEAELAAPARADEVDAARYRHMRASAGFQNRNGPGLYWYLPRWPMDGTFPERLDAAIDAARAAQEGGQG